MWSATGAGEGVLGVGVDVHLHDAVLQRLAISSSVEPEPPWKTKSNGSAPAGRTSRRRRPGSSLSSSGTQHDVARLVDAVDVAEGGGQQVAALLAQAERLGGAHRVVDGGVQLVVDLVRDAVLLAAGGVISTSRMILAAAASVEQLLRDGQVVGEGLGRAVPHVRLEQRVLAARRRAPGEIASSGRT